MEVAEAALVIDLEDQPVYWHLPAGRTPTVIPDSRDLWLVLWANRERLAGVAHTHPAGILTPSRTDLRTFAACEDGLGRRLVWWIVTPAEVVVCSFRDGAPDGYICRPDSDRHTWVDELRRCSWPPATDDLSNRRDVTDNRAGRHGPTDTREEDNP